MNKELYSEIFRRRSFHTFRERTDEPIAEKEIEEICEAYRSFDPLFDIRTEIKIVKREETNCHRNAEYCILLFSEKKEGYLQNIGYLGEQLDLYLVSRNIGSLWFGIAKSDEVYDGLDYVIMIAIAKVSSFRKDMFKAKRKELKETWSGEELPIANIARFSPSACNSQPWYVKNEGNRLSVYRRSRSGKVGIMPKGASVYYNQIDIGIYLCILELCMLKEEITFKRELHTDGQGYDSPELNAVYFLAE